MYLHASYFCNLWHLLPVFLTLLFKLWHTVLWFMAQHDKKISDRFLSLNVPALLL